MELHLECPRLSVCFDHLLLEGDAAETHISATVGPWDVELSTFSGGLYAAKVRFASSAYVVASPTERHMIDKA